MKEKEKMLGQPKQGKSCESEGQEDIMSKSEKSEEAVVRNEKAPKIQSEQNSSVTGLSPIKSLHKARIQPTLPNLLTKYGLEVKDAVQTRVRVFFCLLVMVCTICTYAHSTDLHTMHNAGS